MKIEEIVDILKTQGNFKTEAVLYETALYYFGAILINMHNIRKLGSKNIINFYGLIFSQSGTGKDFSFSTVSKVINIDAMKYKRLVHVGFNINTKEQYSEEAIETMRANLAEEVHIGLEGTKEGLFSVAKAQSASAVCSLNLVHPEFGDTLGSGDNNRLLNGLKELYDGSLKAKTVKSENQSSVAGLATNLFAFGSHAGIAHENRNALARMVKSGMYRRTFIFDIPPSQIERNREESKDMSEVVIYFNKLKAHYANMFNEHYDKTNNPIFDEYMDISESGSKKLIEIQDELIELANSDIYDDLKKSEVGAISMIENLSYIIAFLEMRSEVCENDVTRAYDYYKRARATTNDTFKVKRPYKAMYELLNRGKPLSITEMAELDNSIPTSKNKLDDELAHLEEYCYRKNIKFTKSGSSLVRYSIEEMEKTDLMNMIVSFNATTNPTGIDFIPYEIPFFGKDTASIEKLVTSKKTLSFCLSHFEPSAKAHNGHRQEKSHIAGQNMVAFDIDDGMELENTINKLSQYTYIIYTTKSHMKDKNGEIAERFRVILPTKSKFYVSPEQHKKLYENISKAIDMPIYDVSTRNVSRLWYTNSEGEVYKNEAELLDVSAYIPSTEKSEKVMPLVEQINKSISSGSFDKRLAGMFKWFVSNTSNGSRHDNLTRLAYFVKDLGMPIRENVDRANAMLAEPMTEKDMRKIYSIENK